ncbi:unnamed protein product [Rotaria socialis]|uniref:Uncharacterized protein n=1 Tax=Rotaria socialis TaxID=392032 RepID=A0A820W5R1_9BILA|nr:unnamed protein product [Rotaria socialis]CAF3429116.1 unnamed protein product [Rotaria socialis]CAF3654364.1 unnamed protein product [Rotaria socialis]CAF4355431.1 unnamed protein product [Rotaria socialis]CAF4416883.1 unnamed protein product [Rotaria socialis]
MRYFIFYPPSQSLRLIDVTEDDCVENTLISIKQEFDLKVYDNGSSDKSVVLNYNGCDLKPKWTFGDLNIPSGAIIRCVTRQQQAADLYIHCGFNKQILKLFDSSITIGTTIGTIRKKISDKIGLPLSTFCLESYDGKQRLYDDMKLMTYDIKVHDHVYLKVWQGYEKFINSCIKGFTEHFSHDDVIRHYQSQIALYVAAFYGHLDLARSVIEQGARSDRPVGEHPSRQWSLETSTQALPEMLKCPIHIAVERGHIKMVDIFVRHSVLCTQIRDPTTHYLPYQLANAHLLSANTKEEKQRYSEIYYYLKNKQFNLKIPLTASGEYVTQLLTSSTSVSSNPVFALSAFFGHISLSMYCKIISWYERAREKVWKRTGGHLFTASPAKRIYPVTGLLGYKVLIDGYNNKFEVPVEQLRGARYSGTNKSDHFDHYVGFSDEERQKIIQTKAYIKQFALDERRRAKQIARARLQQARQTPTSLPRTSADLQKHRTITISEDVSSSSELFMGQYLASFSATNTKAMKPIVELDNSSTTTSLLQSTVINPNRSDTSLESKEKMKKTSKTSQVAPSSTVVSEENKHILPSIVSTTTNKLEIVAHTTNTQAFQPMMSSADAYILSSSRIALDTAATKATRTYELYQQNEQSPQQEQHSKDASRSVPVQRAPMLDLDSHIPLPDHPKTTSFGPIKSRIDLEIRQSTLQSYERYSSATTRSTAIQCLEEASFFKKKTWIKKVEISKEMLKHKVQQRMRRAIDETNKMPVLTTCQSAITKPSHNSNTIKVN